ncbi:MAG: TetR/AcrR family transcriptional regulator [Desulfobacterales bacterium]|nr:TetR/AcrR family transcriptional regulator [Desulfobacterales bacterium]
MGNKKKERRETMEHLMRRDILESTMAVIKTVGVAGLTMEMVAQRADIAKGTLYLYFKNKQTLLDEMVMYLFSPMDEYYRDILNADKTPLEKLDQCARMSLGFIETHLDLIREMRNCVFAAQIRDIKKKESWYWVAVDCFASILEDGMARKEFRPLDSRKTGALFLDAINSLAKQRVYAHTEASVDQDVSLLISLYSKGIIQ